MSCTKIIHRVTCERKYLACIYSQQKVRKQLPGGCGWLGGWVTALPTTGSRIIPVKPLGNYLVAPNHSFGIATYINNWRVENYITGLWSYSIWKSPTLLGSTVDYWCRATILHSSGDRRVRMLTAFGGLWDAKSPPILATHTCKTIKCDEKIAFICRVPIFWPKPCLSTGRELVSTFES